MKDVLIVGFGIAGLSVAKQLENQSKSFDILSDDSQQSSKVAGGVLNPVALKRYNLAWNAEEFMPEAIGFYNQFNQNSDQIFFEAVPVYKLFSSVEDQNNWTVASDKLKLDPFLNPKIKRIESTVKQDFKAAEVLQSHLLHLKDLQKDQKTYYTQNHQFFSESIEYSRIEFSRNYLSYNNRKYKTIVFCEGFGVINNPFFNWLPVYGNKGEYLIFKSEQLNANKAILKSRNFIIPMGNDLYKYGATYSRQNLNDSPTRDARLDLEGKLSEMIDADFEVIDQIAGVRPTVKDRKPILGKHPEHDNLFVLNGFGSRGVMAAPQLSRNLIEHIFEGKPIDEEVAIDRFLKLYP